jgi:hypothetical protein
MTPTTFNDQNILCLPIEKLTHRCLNSRTQANCDSCTGFERTLQKRAALIEQLKKKGWV